MKVLRQKKMGCAEFLIARMNSSFFTMSKNSSTFCNDVSFSSISLKEEHFKKSHIIWNQVLL